MKSTRFETMVAAAIAIISILVALFAGAAARRYSFASDSDRNSIVATVNRESVNLTAHARLFENKRRHAEFYIYDALAYESTFFALKDDTLLQETMDSRAQEFRAAANTAALYYSPNYVQQDGSFNDALFLDDEFQFQFDRRDIDPKDDLAQAEAHYTRTSNLMISVVSFSFAIVLFTVAQHSSSKLRYILFTFGAMVALGGLCYFITFNLIPQL